MLQFMPAEKKYRSNLEIAAMMLEAVRGNGTPPFSIMRRTSVNSKQLKKYMGSLTAMGFVEVDSDGHRFVYKATNKGLEFLKQYNVLQRMMLTART